jgi:hypothetical protein
MSTILRLKNSLYHKLGIPEGAKRRGLLINEMENLANKNIHCLVCSGNCCTFSANSMQITPIEAFEIILSLDLNKENSYQLKNKLQQNIVEYRLDHEIYLGKKNHSNSHLRKTYSCPFFIAGSKGCTIKKKFKPYGCLGFNPRTPNDNGSQCHLNTSLMEAREELELKIENVANDFIKKELQLNWTKMEIPKAVLAIIEKIF